MMSFLTRFFAIIGLSVTVILVAAGYYAAWQARPPQEPEAVVLSLDLSQSISERSEPSPINIALEEPVSPSLLDIVTMLDRAQHDPRVKGLMAKFGEGDFSMAQAQDIRAALARFRAAGKFTYAFATSYGDFGLSNKDYYLASAFENIWLQPVGTVGLTGIAVQSLFAKTALDKVGVKADFMQREEYKSFMDMGTRDDFAPPVRKMMQGLADDLAHQVAEGIATSRGWKVEDVQELMARGPYVASEAVKLNLVTHLGYEDEMVAEAQKKAGDNAVQVALVDYRDFGYGGGAEKAKDEAAQSSKVALIYGLGMISENADEGALAGDQVMSAPDIADAFASATEDKDVEAILFRIDSPGGSPEASETIRHALKRAKDHGKKVVVSMGEAAASGGYWVAMDADHIVAAPATLTGSIGVVGGKFVIGGLLEKLGISVGTLTTDGHAGLWSMTAEYTPAQRARVNAMLDETYRTFVEGVAQGRRIPLEKMPDIAKGRVWTGAQAVKIGLVDELGGYDVAFAAVRHQLGLADDAFLYFQEYPRPLTPIEHIMKMLKGFGLESAMIRSCVRMLAVVQKVVLGVGMSSSTHPISATMPPVMVR